MGVLGYTIIERDNADHTWSLFDAIYMTVITLTTVGYDDENMSGGGKVFTVFLLIGGFGVFVYSINASTAFIIEGQFQKIYRRRKMIKAIDKLSNHYSLHYLRVG